MQVAVGPCIWCSCAALWSPAVCPSPCSLSIGGCLNILTTRLPKKNPLLPTDTNILIRRLVCMRNIRVRRIQKSIEEFFNAQKDCTHNWSVETPKILQYMESHLESHGISSQLATTTSPLKTVSIRCRYYAPGLRRHGRCRVGRLRRCHTVHRTKWGYSQIIQGWTTLWVN